MHYRHLALAALFFIWPPDADAQGDPERGRAKAEACQSCHGETGKSELEATPSLAAQPEMYLFNQLFLFREGLRQTETMTPFVQGLTDEDLQDLAAFFSRQKLAPVAAAGDPKLVARGAELSQKLYCGTCHLPGYVGRAQMPRLAGQREDYLLIALQQYQANQRAGIDTSMIAVLYGLSGDDLAALAHYLAHQN